MRALEQAGETAPWGKGMESLEAVIHDKGFEHLRNMLSLAANARPEAQKKGGLFPAVRWVPRTREVQSRPRKVGVEQRRARDGGSALLRVRLVRRQTGALGPVGGTAGQPFADAARVAVGDAGGDELAVRPGRNDGPSGSAPCAVWTIVATGTPTGGQKQRELPRSGTTPPLLCGLRSAEFKATTGVNERGGDDRQRGAVHAH